VTKYLEDHPGGVAVLHEVAGTDATEAFEEVGHSLEANEDLSALYLGDLAVEDHADAVEVFRPTFHNVGQTAAVVVTKKSNKGRRAVPALATVLAIGAGAAVLVNRGQGLGGSRTDQIVKMVQQSLSILKKSLPLSLAPGPDAGRSGLFWWGAGLATAAQISLSVVVGLWAWSKLDVQEEFTRYPAYRTSKPDRRLAVLKVPTSSTNQSGALAAAVARAVDPMEWRSFKLVRKTLVSPNVYRFVFALPRADQPLGLPTGQHVALRATINGKMVARSYTPVSNNSDLGRIELLIKVYDKGLLTQHLEGMEVGQTIDIRGPKGAMQYKPLEYAKHIGMIAGGTGITPMFQMIRAICEDDSDTTTMSLLYASNTEADILLRDELDNYVKQCPGKLRVQYVLAKPSEGWTGSTGFINMDLIKQHLPAAAEDTRMLLCGPPPMIQAVSKTLVQLGFKAPGAMSKAADQVFLF
jgi:cytochrome-b5 reductase